MAQTRPIIASQHQSTNLPLRKYRESSLLAKSTTYSRGWQILRSPGSTLGEACDRLANGLLQPCLPETTHLPVSCEVARTGLSTSYVRRRPSKHSRLHSQASSFFIALLESSSRQTIAAARRPGGQASRVKPDRPIALWPRTSDLCPPNCRSEPRLWREKRDQQICETLILGQCKVAFEHVCQTNHTHRVADSPAHGTGYGASTWLRLLPDCRRADTGGQQIFKEL